jgi:hypothetical protein
MASAAVSHRLCGVRGSSRCWRPRMTHERYRENAVVAAKKRGIVRYG